MSLRHAPWEEAAEFRIGLRPIPQDAWLEGGEAEPWRRKDALLATHPEAVWAETPGSRPAQAEALQLVRTQDGAEPPRLQGPPLYAAARRIADDLCLMERRGGEWRLTALSLSAGTYFTAGEVIGRSLAELHDPVPGFGRALLRRVARIFDALRPELILERRNWTVVNAPDLFAPDPGPVRARLPQIPPAEAGRQLHLRVERQTIRRLPESGGVLFTIRVWIDPLQALATDPQRLGRFAAAWRACDPAFAAYKRFELYAPLVEAFLAQAGAVDGA